MALVLLQSVGDNVEASALRALLEAHGVRCVVQGEQHRSMLGIMGAYIELRVLVDEAELTKAQRVVAEAEETHGLPEAESAGALAAGTDALCPVHEQPAIATCTRCGTFLCPACGAAPDLPVCEDCESREATPDLQKARRRRVSAAVVFLLLFAGPLVVLGLYELARLLFRLR